MLVIGLGNPGGEYARTRHNLGFLVVNELARRGRIRVDRRECESLTGRMRYAGRTWFLAQPQTFMNLSGRAAACLLRSAQLPPEELLVVCDDVNLPFGVLRLRQSGSDGGHNGLKDIIAHVGEGFGRLRIGCGPAPRYADLADFVLEPFPEEQWEALPPILDRAAEGLLMLARRGWSAAMAQVNARPREDETEQENTG